jgi:geranylgeranyl reductase family protein
VIVGAGPAGATASAFLCRDNVPHLIVDKAVFPRDKICGDALSGKVFPVLKKLDPDIISRISADTTHFLGSNGIRFAAPNGNHIDIPFGKNPELRTYPPGFISRRMDFDHLLTTLISPKVADFRQGHELIRAERRDGGWLLHMEGGGSRYTVVADLVIGAEGDRSLLSKASGCANRNPEHYCAGIRAYYRGVTNFHPQNFIELHFIPELLPGYLWVFPLPGGMANVGAGMLSSVISRKRINLKQSMLDALQNHKTLRDRFSNATMESAIAGWGLPLGSRKRKISSGHLLLTGDAASMIDPFTGEGISNAMYCGMTAASVAGLAVKQRNYTAEFLNQYDEQVYRRLWNELKLSHTLQKLCNFPRLFNLVVNRANKSETLRETISCMFDDLDLRTRFLDPAFYLKLIMNR